MIIETTININIELKNKLIRASLLSGKTQKQILSFLLYKLKKEYGMSAHSWVRLKYQKRDPRKRWSKHHIVLSPGEYEYCSDLKKVCKYSLSGLIAYAIEKYLDDISWISNVDTDNYHCSNYIFSNIVVDGIICWQFFWGIPKKIMIKPYICSIP